MQKKSATAIFNVFIKNSIEKRNLIVRVLHMLYGEIPIQIHLLYQPSIKLT